MARVSQGRIGEYLYARAYELRKTPEALRQYARRILAVRDPSSLTEWEIDFLDSIGSRSEVDAFSESQTAKVEEIERLSRTFRDWDGRSVSRLIETCWQAQRDLDEDDLDWIEHIRSRATDYVYGRDIYRLVRLADGLIGEIYA